MAQAIGNEFETSIYKALVERKYDTVLRERELVQKYGQRAIAIDIMVIHRNIHLCIQVKWENISSMDAVQKLADSTQHIRNIINDTSMVNIEFSQMIITKNKFKPNIIRQFNETIFVYHEDPHRDFIEMIMAEISKVINVIEEPVCKTGTKLDVHNMTIAAVKEALCTEQIIRFKYQRDVDHDRLDSIQNWILTTWGTGAWYIPRITLHLRKDGRYDIVDGQHRLHAMKRIPKDDIAIRPGLTEWKIPIDIIENRTDQELIAIFKSINSGIPVKGIYLDPTKLVDDISKAFVYVKNLFNDYTSKSPNPRFPNINFDQAVDQIKRSNIVQNLLDQGKIKTTQDIQKLIENLNFRLRDELRASNDKTATLNSWGGDTSKIDIHIAIVESKITPCYLSFIRGNNWLKML